MIYTYGDNFKIILEILESTLHPIRESPLNLIVESVLLSICPERDLSGSSIGSEEAYDVVVELSCFSGLIFLAAPSNAYTEHLLQALPSDNYTSQLGEVNRTL